MIDASKGFIKDGPKNRLRAQDIHKIVDTFTRQAEVSRYARMVSVAEISDPKNDYNLNLPRYIDSTESGLQYSNQANAMAEAGADQANLSAIDRIHAVTREEYAGLTLLGIVMAVKNRRKKTTIRPKRAIARSSQRML